MADIPLIQGYRIERELGAGGMANVYLGVQEKLEREVAIKVLDPVLLRDPNFARRFMKEAQTAAKLVHPGIVTVHDVGQSGMHYYMVMEYLDGGSLKDLIHPGPVPPEQALDIVRRVATALQYAHVEGYVHRDIKPDNIMFRKDGTPVITDFGIARAVDSTTKLTKTGMSIGTPHYMSPEQARGQGGVDARTDIYSLGIVLFEMLTGKVPYEADNTVGIVIKHLQDPLPQLPLNLKRYQGLLDGMLAKDPAHRVQSGSKVCELVGALLGLTATPPNAIPMPRPAPKARQEARPPREGAAPAAPAFPASPPVRRPEFPGNISDRESTSRPSAGRRAAKVLFGILAVLVVVLVIVLTQNKSSQSRPPAVEPQTQPSSAVSGRFINNGNGTVTDTQTNLMWAAKDNENDIDWDGAKHYCENFSTGGYSDWRMPTINELQSLYDTQYSRKSECGWDVHITPLIHLSCSCVWSSETDGSSDARYFGFLFGFAFSNYRSNSSGGRALPVRSRR